MNNSGNIIRNNLLYDFLNPYNSTDSYGVYLNNSTNFEISGNSFYETTNFSPASGANFEIIYCFITNGTVISGNYIGGSAPHCGGGYWTKSGGDNEFRGICNNNNSSTLSIQGNIIRNISWTNTGSKPFYAVWGRLGILNVGNVQGNIIGSATGINSIVFTSGTTSNFYAIGDSYRTTFNVQNNTIGGITTACSLPDKACNFYGIYPKWQTDFTCKNNMIGSLDTPNSIMASSPSTVDRQDVYGIWRQSLSLNIITGNTVANLTNGTTNSNVSVTGTIIGILLWNGGTITISGNTVRDLTISNANNKSNTTQLVGYSSAIGILCINGANLPTKIINNTVYNISNNYSGFTGVVKGIHVVASVQGSDGLIVTGNLVYNLSVDAGTSGASIYGIRFDPVPNLHPECIYHFSNNIVLLGGNTSSTLCGIYHDNSGGATFTNNNFFNTVVISGNPSSGSVNPSYAFYNNFDNSSIFDFRNNLFINYRSTPCGSNLHYAAYLNNISSSNLTLDYNDYYVTGEGGVIGFWNGTNQATLPIVTDKDVHSLTINPQFNNSGGTMAASYMPAATLTGASGTTVTTDFGGTTRPDPPTMGAWEQRFELGWTGGAGTTDWNTACNWNPARVPSRYSDLSVPSAPAYQPVVNEAPSTPATCNNLTIASGASLKIAAGKALTVNGALTNNGGNSGLVLQSDAGGTGSLIHYSDNVPATVQTFITGSSNLEAMRYHFVSLPIKYTAPTAGLFHGSYLYELDPSALLTANNYGVWDPVGSSYSAPLSANKGYMIYYPDASTTYTFSGNLNNGNYPQELTGHSGTGVYTFNLIPNPYPSAINWKSGSGWSRSPGIGGSCYVWSATAGNYVTLSSLTDNYIPVGQAYMALVYDEASPSLTINNPARAHSSQAFYKSGNSLPNQLTIKASTNTFSDLTTVVFSDDATDEFDLPLDGFKIYGLDKAPQLYTISGDKKYSLNSLPLFQDQRTVEMNFEMKFTGDVTLSFEGVESFDASLKILLKDELTGQTINLRSQPAYTFSHLPENSPNRFKIIFGGVTGVEESVTTSGNLWISGKTLYFRSTKLAGQTGLVEVYNLSGQKLMSKPILLSEFSTMELEASGFVIVRLVAGQTVLAGKGILKK